MTFQLDTSGAVRGPFNVTGYLTFDDLDPFTQGYVEALFAALEAMRPPRDCADLLLTDGSARKVNIQVGHGGWRMRRPRWRRDGGWCVWDAGWCSIAKPARGVWFILPPPAFYRLARETLARIIEDCALAGPFWCMPKTAEGGRNFWAARQNPGKWNNTGTFPPLTVSLGDDGKVYLREVGR